MICLDGHHTVFTAYRPPEDGAVTQIYDASKFGDDVDDDDKNDKGDACTVRPLCVYPDQLAFDVADW